MSSEPVTSGDCARLSDRRVQHADPLTYATPAVSQSRIVGSVEYRYKLDAIEKFSQSCWDTGQGTTCPAAHPLLIAR